MSYFALVLDAHIITSQETQQRLVARSSSSEILWRVMNPIFLSYCTDCCLSTGISWVLVDWFTRTYVHVLLHAGACNDAQFACFARAVRGTRERYCIGASDKDIFNSKGTQNMEQLLNNSFCFQLYEANRNNSKSLFTDVCFLIKFSFGVRRWQTEPSHLDLL